MLTHQDLTDVQLELIKLLHLAVVVVLVVVEDPLGDPEVALVEDTVSSWFFLDCDWMLI
jgi:hypothetical protein